MHKPAKPVASAAGAAAVDVAAAVTRLAIPDRPKKAAKAKSLVKPLKLSMKLPLPK